MKLLQHPVPSVAEQDEGLLVGMCVFIHIRVLIHIRVYVYMHACMCAYIYAHTHTHLPKLLVDPQSPRSLQKSSWASLVPTAVMVPHSETRAHVAPGPLTLHASESSLMFAGAYTTAVTHHGHMGHSDLQSCFSSWCCRSPYAYVGNHTHKELDIVFNEKTGQTMLIRSRAWPGRHTTQQPLYI